MAAPLLAAAALAILPFGFVLLWEQSTRDYVAAARDVQWPGSDSDGVAMLLDPTIREPLGDAALALLRGSSSRIDYPYGFVTNDPRVCFGIALACAAFALAFRLHVGRGERIQRRAWAVFVSVLGTAGLALGGITGALYLRGRADASLDRRDVATRFEVARSFEEVVQQVRPVFYAREYRVHSESGAQVARVQGGERIALVRRMRLHQSDAGDRWELTASGPRRESPELLLTLVSAVDSQRTFVTIEAGSLDANSQRIESWRREIEELGRELAAGTGAAKPGRQRP